MSAAILFLIVGMWAALIVPMLVRRHDETLEARSVDRFSTAMRVLSRRPAGRYVVVPRRPDGADEPVLSPPVGRTLRVRSEAAGRAGLRGLDGLRLSLRDRVHAWQDARDERPLTAVQRRRRTFTVLVALVLVTLGLGLSPAGGRPAWTLHVLADLALLACVVVLRVQVVRAAQAAWLAETEGDGWGEGEHWTTAWADPEVWGDEADDDWRVQPVEDLPVVAEADLESAVPLAPGSPWQPVPVPVPTYVTAPTAPRRVLDLDPPAAPAADAMVDEDADALDGILEGRRAVGS